MSIRNPGSGVVNVKTGIVRQISFCILLITAIILSAGCIQTNTPPETTEVAAPPGLTSGLLDFTRDVRNIDTSISIDLNNLANHFGKAKNNAEIKSLAGAYYADSPWLDKLIYHDANTGEYLEIPIQLDTEFENSLPHPTEQELKNAGGFKYYDSVFLPEDGYMNVVCMAVYNKDKTYRGYFTIIYDYFVTINLHPLVIGKERSYKDFACTIIDGSGKIIYSSNQEYIGETIQDVMACGVTVIQRSIVPSGAYSYESPAFYNYKRDISTTKITAWGQYTAHKTKYTLYLTKEVDRVPIEPVDVYTSSPEQAEKDVSDAFVYSVQQGVDALMKRVNSGYYKTPLGILDYNGTVLAISGQDSVGLNYLNNRGAYGNAYVKYMVYTAKQGGGYAYYLYPADDSVRTPASELSIAYILPLEGDCFIFGRFSGDEDLVMGGTSIMEDVTRVSREVVKEAFDDGIDAVITKINTNPHKNTSMFVHGLKTNVEDLGIIDFTGTIHASVYNPGVVGYSLTGYRDVYGGSTVRKLIMVARSGGGYAAEMYPNPTREGYVDFWLYSIEPVDDTYIIYTGAVVKTIEDKSPKLAGLNIK